MVTRRHFSEMVFGLSAFTQSAKYLLADSGAAASAPGADIRRIGVRPNGSYWGISNESIDMLSGNLNVSNGLLLALSRKVQVILLASYNSQMWKIGSRGLAAYGSDTGFGFGWKIQFGSIMPCLVDGQVTGYVYIDRTGAEFPLTECSSGIWISLQGVYLSYEPASNCLTLPNGTRWELGCKAAPGEPDAGSYYPTLIQDSNGNQIIITYMAGVGMTNTNSSARVLYIEDARAVNLSSGRWTYAFRYSADPMPHLLSIDDDSGTGNSLEFQYATAVVRSPFVGQQDVTTVQLLQRITKNAVAKTNYSYNQFGELTNLRTAHGGSLRWHYETVSFSDGRQIREVSRREASTGTTPLVSAIVRNQPDVDTSIHSQATLTDGTGLTQRVWNFNTDGNRAEIGSLSSLGEYDSVGSLARETVYTWTVDAAGRWYLSSQRIASFPNAPGASSVVTEFVRDPFGNITTKRTFDANNPMSSREVSTCTYVTDGQYLSRRICNCLLSNVVQKGDMVVQTVYNKYDSLPLVDRPNVLEHDSANYGPDRPIRGNLTESVINGEYRQLYYDITGFVIQLQDGNDRLSFTPAAETNNMEVGTMLEGDSRNQTTQTHWDSCVRPKAITRPTGGKVSLAYNNLGLPANITSGDGTTTGLTYNFNPTSLSYSRGDLLVKVNYDGFGRPITVQMQDISGVPTILEVEYGPAPNSPVGKVTRRSLPHRPGDPPQWINFTWDALGGLAAPELPGSKPAQQMLPPSTFLDHFWAQRFCDPRVLIQPPDTA